MSLVWLGLLAWIAFDALCLCVLLLVGLCRERRLRSFAAELAKAAEQYANRVPSRALSNRTHAPVGGYRRRSG